MPKTPYLTTDVTLYGVHCKMSSYVCNGYIRDVRPPCNLEGLRSKTRIYVTGYEKNHPAWLLHPHERTDNTFTS